MGLNNDTAKDNRTNDTSTDNPEGMSNNRHVLLLSDSNENTTMDFYFETTTDNPEITEISNEFIDTDLEVASTSAPLYFTEEAVSTHNNANKSDVHNKTEHQDGMTINFDVTANNYDFYFVKDNDDNTTNAPESTNIDHNFSFESEDSNQHTTVAPHITVINQNHDNTKTNTLGYDGTNKTEILFDTNKTGENSSISFDNTTNNHVLDVETNDKIGTITSQKSISINQNHLYSKNDIIVTRTSPYNEPANLGFNIGRSVLRLFGFYHANGSDAYFLKADSKKPIVLIESLLLNKRV